MSNVALLVNPTAGKGRAANVVAKVTERLRQGGASVAILVGRDVEDAKSLARQAIDDGVDALVALGGDGMVHLALNIVAGTKTPLGIVPAGTGNDLAATLGLPTKDPVAAAGVIADLLSTTGPRPMDAVRVGTDKWFGCVLSAGFDTGPSTVMSTRPSSISASGVIFMPAPYDLAFPTATNMASVSHSSPSISISNGIGLKTPSSARMARL